MEAVNYVEGENEGVEGTEESDFDDLPVAAPAKDLDRKVEIPAHVLCDKEATKRYLKALRRQERDRKRLEEAATTTEELPEHVVDLYERAIKQVPKEYHKKIHTIIAQHSRVFAKSAGDMGRTTWVRHDIDTGDHSPVRVYRKEALFARAKASGRRTLCLLKRRMGHGACALTIGILILRLSTPTYTCCPE